jgi:hypothetical protein
MTKVRKNQIPIALALNRREREWARCNYHLNEFERENPNFAGWKLAHIESVGLNHSGKLTELDLSTLKKHFVNLMTPSNMFVIPMEYAGLAELPEFCEQIKRIDYRYGLPRQVGRSVDRMQVSELRRENVCKA